jgi:hypothetical protein
MELWMKMVGKRLNGGKCGRKIYVGEVEDWEGRESIGIKCRWFVGSSSSRTKQSIQAQALKRFNVSSNTNSVVPNQPCKSPTVSTINKTCNSSSHSKPSETSWKMTHSISLSLFFRHIFTTKDVISFPSRNSRKTQPCIHSFFSTDEPHASKFNLSEKSFLVWFPLVKISFFRGKHQVLI